VSTEQEYETHTDMVDDQDPSETAGPGPYPEPFATGQQRQLHQQQMLSHQQHLGHPGQAPVLQPGDNAQGYASMTQQLLDPFDPMLDMDPFGLSASMQFPTQFSFDTSSMR